MACVLFAQELKNINSIKRIGILLKLIYKLRVMTVRMQGFKKF